MSRERTIPTLKPGQRQVSKQIPAGIDGFTAPIGWNFSGMETDSGCEWCCTFKRLNKFTKRLLAFEGKSFKDIEAEPGSSHSWSDTSKLHKGLQELIRKRNIDGESLWQLELGGKERLFGVRQHNIFKVMWMDLNHRAYSVPKKHT